MSYSVLFLVEGDTLSRQAEAAALKSKFQGTMVKLTKDEALVQTTPLPLLLVADGTYGPSSVQDYFLAKRK